MASELDDTPLVAAARRGDTVAFTQLFNRHITAVYWQAYAVVRDADEAQDIAQDVFVTCWRRLGEITTVDGSMLPWLLVTAKYTALNAHRKRSRLRSVPLETEPSDPAPRPDHVVEADAVRSAVDSAVATLAPLDQQLFSLCIDGDLTYDQAAARLGVTHGAVRNRLSRVRGRLRNDLGDLREDS